MEEVLKAAESGSVAGVEVVEDVNLHAENGTEDPENEDVAMTIDEAASEHEPASEPAPTTQVCCGRCTTFHFICSLTRN